MLAAPMDAADDETLMLRYRDGDARAFDTLYARHKGPVFRYLLRQCNSPVVAEELFQDVWLKLIRARHGYTVKARFATWLYTLAHHRLIDHYRARGRGLPPSYRDDPLPEELPAREADNPEIQETRRRRTEQIAAVVAQLPEAQREAFLLHAEAGLTLEAIAQATGVGRETVKSRLRYAVAKLRRGLEDR